MIRMKHFRVILSKHFKLLFFPDSCLLLSQSPLAIGKLLEETGSVKHAGNYLIEILVPREPSIITPKEMLRY